MTLQDFAGREGAALVAGGSGGIGAAVCRMLAARGSDVALTYHRNQDRAGAVVAEVEALGRKAAAWQVTLDKPGAMAAFVAEAADVMGGVHTVVYASGPHVPMTHVSRLAPEEFRRQLEVDAAAFFDLAHAALPLLRESGGVIVAVTTVANRRFPRRDAMSSAPKGAVEALVRAIAAEEGRFGVRANSVGPGIMGDGMTARLVDTGELSAAELDATRDAIPLRRLGTAEDVAEAVCFLASDAARYVTGQYLDIDGGYSL